MNELLAHLVGDYILQNNWEAQNKTKKWLPALSHVVKYTAAFVPVTRNWKALAIIGGTHLVLDHYRVAIPLSWAKNNILVPSEEKYDYTRDNAGYAPETPPWLSTWLMIITDNTLHMIINHVAIERFKNG